MAIFSMSGIFRNKDIILEKVNEDDRFIIPVAVNILSFRVRNNSSLYRGTNEARMSAVWDRGRCRLKVIVKQSKGEKSSLRLSGDFADRGEALILIPWIRKAENSGGYQPAVKGRVKISGKITLL
jgi:hypothetical protein